MGAAPAASARLSGARGGGRRGRATVGAGTGPVAERATAGSHSERPDRARPSNNHSLPPPGRVSPQRQTRPVERSEGGRRRCDATPADLGGTDAAILVNGRCPAKRAGAAGASEREKSIEGQVCRVWAAAAAAAAAPDARGERGRCGPA